MANSCQAGVQIQRISILLLVALAAGCLDADFEPGTENWRSCRWTYLDGAPMRCNGDAVELRPSNAPMDLLCVFGAQYPGVGSLEIHLSPTMQANFLRFRLTEGVASGVIGIEVDDTRYLFNWTRQASTDFRLPMPGFVEADSIEFGVYLTALETSHPELSDVEHMHEAWSIQGEDWNAVRRVITKDDAFLFYGRSATPLGTTGAGTFTLEDPMGNSTFLINPLMEGSFTAATATQATRCSSP